MSRKSLANIILGAQQVLGDNDDEKERLILRRQSKENSVAVSETPSNRRHSLGLNRLINIPEPQMREHMSHCIKLNAENKINVKNAFSLEMIDFMTFIVTKTQSKDTDLQVASVALDVCTNIYAHRVDSLYADILKMAGGLNKREKVTDASNEQPLCENDQMQTKTEVKKKKKNKQKICSTESALKGSIETLNPSQSIIGSTDSCTSDMLYQAVLPLHANSAFYYHQYKDVILDVVDDVTAHKENFPEYTIAAVEDCSNLDICSSFADFQFLNCSHEDEPEVTESNQQNNETRFQFDLDASIPIADDHESEPVNYFNIEEEENNVNPCARNVEQVENIVDLRNIVLMQVPELNKPSEYSFIQKNCIPWAGPSYWKIKTFGKVLSNSKVIETCRQVGVKKNKTVVLEYNGDIKSEVEQEFTIVDAIKTQFRTTPKSWKETKKTLPEDIHYNDSQLNMLYLYPQIIVNSNQNQDKLNTPKLPEDENYNYNNENDMSDFCPDIDTQNEEMQEGNDLEELRAKDNDMEQNKVAFIGDNLIPVPKLTQKLFIPYAQRAKKVDMRQLKQCIWKSLTSSSNEEKKDMEKAEEESEKKVRESKPFNMVYKSLSTTLSETNREALSVPIAFVSLLHLANEKSLSLSAVSDLSDIIINEE